MLTKVFYHICPMNHAYQVVVEHIMAMHYSGLYDVVEGIYCCLGGGNPDVAASIKKFLHTAGKKIHILRDEPNDTSYERLTLLEMHEHVADSDCILYIHSKGVSVGTENPESSERKSDWNRVLSYFLIKYHAICVNVLCAGFDLIGPNYDKRGIYPLHFSGNMWWVRGSYYKSLPKQIGPGYLDPEFYVCQNNPTVFGMHNTHEDHHANTYKLERYVD